MGKTLRVLLVNPWIYDFAAYDLWLKPLGLLYIGKVLINLGCEVDLIDCLDRYHLSNSPYFKEVSIEGKYGCGRYWSEDVKKPEVLKHIPRKYKRYGLPVSIFVDRIRTNFPALILLSSGMTYWYPGVVEAAGILKKQFKNVPIILGGNYASLCFEHALKNSGVDYVFKGDNIKELVKLISKITDTELNCNDVPLNFSDFPAPAYELYQTNRYIAIRTSRGCPFRCSYCAVGILTDGFEQKSPQKIVDEIIYFNSKFGVKDFAFYDDSLLFNSDYHIRSILEGIIKEKINCRFHTPNGLQAKFLTQELAKLMYRAGFVEPILSLETVDTVRQIEMGGKVTTEEVTRATSYFKEAGYKLKEFGIYIMIGLFRQNHDEIHNSILFASNLGAKVKLVEYSPIPNTKEWELAHLGHDVDPLFHNNSIFYLYNVKDWELFRNLKNLTLKLNREN